MMVTLKFIKLRRSRAVELNERMRKFPPPSNAVRSRTRSPVLTWQLPDDHTKASRAEGGYNLTTKRSRAAAGVVAGTQSTVFLNYEDVYDRSESMWHLNK